MLKVTFEDAKKIKAQLEENCKKLGEAFDKYPRGAMGLIADYIKATPEYQRERKLYNIAFTQLQNFNKVYVKQFKKEIAKERANRFK